jgi:hypothetical protein
MCAHIHIHIQTYIHTPTTLSATCCGDFRTPDGVLSLRRALTCRTARVSDATQQRTGRMPCIQRHVCVTQHVPATPHDARLRGGYQERIHVCIHSRHIACMSLSTRREVLHVHTQEQVPGSSRSDRRNSGSFGGVVRAPIKRGFFYRIKIHVSGQIAEACSVSMRHRYALTFVHA